ncbi:hypothetical protein [Pollutibacter soli]|uniref:hypothetical protein n=1 Tax=Pollutibacter soli TaxID=3034157 RepID=UPI003013B3AB
MTKVICRYTSITTLVIIAAGAFYGSIPLLKDPSGQSIHFEPGWLNRKIFPDYTFPALVLFVLFGLRGLYIATSGILKSRHYPRMVVVQGVLLVMWILIQILTFKIFSVLQILVSLMAIVLIICGRILLHKQAVILSQPQG